MLTCPFVSSQNSFHHLPTLAHNQDTVWNLFCHNYIKETSSLPALSKQEAKYGDSQQQLGGPGVSATLLDLFWSLAHTISQATLRPPKSPWKQWPKSHLDGDFSQGLGRTEGLDSVSTKVQREEGQTSPVWGRELHMHLPGVYHLPGCPGPWYPRLRIQVRASEELVLCLARPKAAATPVRGSIILEARCSSQQLRQA